MKPYFSINEMSEKKILNIEYNIANSIDDLSDEYKNLYIEAKKSCDTAYAPYSNFNVGAAVLLDNNKVITASNQENAAYPSGLCAERSALFYIGGNYPNNIKAIAVAARKSDVEKFIENISPCGGCRQVMSEFENKQKSNIEFIMPASNGSFIIIKSVKNFLPFEFTSEILNS